MKNSKLIIKLLPTLLIALIVIIAIVTLPSLIGEFTKHDHTYSEWETYKLPTCAYEGSEQRFCDCGDVQRKSTPRLEHTPGEWTVDVEKNEKLLYCTSCNRVISSESLGEHTHSYGEWNIESESTCVSGGIMARYCRCGARQEKALDALAHQYSEWTTVKEPTCYSEGLSQCSCNCGKTSSRIIPMLEHNFDIISTTSHPTCTEEGILEKRCSVCNEFIYESIPKKSHEYGEFEITAEASCSEEGWKTKRCSCGASISEVIDKKEHVWGAQIISKVPTNKNTGTLKSLCINCTNSKSSIIPAITDSPEDWNINQSGTLLDAYSTEKYLSIPEGTLTIASNAFINNENLEILIIPDSVETIKSRALDNRRSLIAIKLSSNIKTIESNAFSYCNSLSYIKISNSIVKIGAWAFDQCDSLKSIEYKGEIADWISLMENIDWKLGISQSYTVICEDGEILVSGSSYTIVNNGN